MSVVRRKGSEEGGEEGEEDWPSLKGEEDLEFDQAGRTKMKRGEGV